MFKKILQRIGMKRQHVCVYMCVWVRRCIETGCKSRIYSYMCCVLRQRDDIEQTLEPPTRSFVLSLSPFFSHSLSIFLTYTLFLKLFKKAIRFSTFEFYSRDVRTYIYIYTYIYPSIHLSVRPYTHLWFGVFLHLTRVCITFSNGGIFYVHIRMYMVCVSLYILTIHTVTKWNPGKIYPWEKNHS